MIRLFLVDDHAVLREGLRQLREQEAGFLVVGEAGDGQQLLDQLPTTPADAVLLDLNVPVLGSVATRARQRFPGFPNPDPAQFPGDVSVVASRSSQPSAFSIPAAWVPLRFSLPYARPSHRRLAPRPALHQRARTHR